ncbi:hypothetical protein BASA50_006400 [Batrachochytrium salamandrivorans]|uniref:Palmitoyltransferase n=1 Tax=Batrachochytrium salamandrivorans TaxID=1357716 RepID=A0ABQ8FA19_9FUNG|nr:hypothetical protein BASA60_007978 [Batrachochytrium salamandrivorans]KAH6594724.1 hypothetical protein BASA50_006400 [Batrachochytrium salamandrivorans]KAH9276649.1 hypothetical protein BASA83_000780 [Batrachochytrium salamandrivorans]
MASLRRNVIKAVGIMPVLFMFALIAWSWFAFVFHICLAKFTAFAAGALIDLILVVTDGVALLLFHTQLVLFVVSFYRTVVTNPGSPSKAQLDAYTESLIDAVPPLLPISRRYHGGAQEEAEILVGDSHPNKGNIFHMKSASSPSGPTASGSVSIQSMDLHSENVDAEQGREDRPVFSTVEVKKNGEQRYCTKCDILKPDRCHHCSICERCILKMDHHCPWVNNCIGFFNYKYFLLFIVHGLFYCLFTFAASLLLIWRPLTPHANWEPLLDIHVILLVFFTGMFTLCLLLFASIHGYYLTNNKTTIEILGGLHKIRLGTHIVNVPPEVNIYYLGVVLNFEQVFGNNPRRWLLPIPSSIGDGYSFPLAQGQLDKLE